MFDIHKIKKGLISSVILSSFGRCCLHVLLQCQASVFKTVMKLEQEYSI